MTDNERRILRRLLCGDAVSYSALDQDDQFAFRCLRRSKLIADHEWFSGSVFITDAGRSALSTEEQRLDDQRKQQSCTQLRHDEERFYQHQQTKKHFRHDWCIAIFTTLAGFVLGVAVEYRFYIVRNAVRLWHSLVG